MQVMLNFIVHSPLAETKCKSSANELLSNKYQQVRQVWSRTDSHLEMGQKFPDMVIKLLFNIKISVVYTEKG